MLFLRYAVVTGGREAQHQHILAKWLISSNDIVLEHPVLNTRKINIASHALECTGHVFFPHFKAGEGRVLRDLHNRSLHRWSIFDLSKWSPSVVICHNPSCLPRWQRKMKFNKFRIQPHSLACQVHITVWTCTSTTCVFRRKHCKI